MPPNWKSVDAMFEDAASLHEAVLLVVDCAERLVGKLVCMADLDTAVLRRQGFTPEQRLLLAAGALGVFDKSDPDVYELKPHIAGMQDALRLREHVARLSEEQLLAEIRAVYHRNFPYDRSPKWREKAGGIELLKYTFFPMLTDARMYVAELQELFEKYAEQSDDDQLTSRDSQF